MKRILINATQPEERRRAIAEGQKLVALEHEDEGPEQRQGTLHHAREPTSTPSP